MLDPVGSVTRVCWAIFSRVFSRRDEIHLRIWRKWTWDDDLTHWPEKYFFQTNKKENGKKKNPNKNQTPRTGNIMLLLYRNGLPRYFYLNVLPELLLFKSTCCQFWTFRWIVIHRFDECFCVISTSLASNNRIKRMKVSWLLKHVLYGNKRRVWFEPDILWWRLMSHADPANITAIDWEYRCRK